MRKLVLFACALAAACHQAPAAQRQAAVPTDVRTIDSSDPRPGVIDPPPMLTDEAAAPKPKNPVEAEKQIPLTEQDEAVRAQLPFAPAIAMDPVDGSKISIRATTPTLEYKGRIFYFHSNENKAAFQAAPEQYMKGVRL
jgi:YHS domain-containing protein